VVTHFETESRRRGLHKPILRILKAAGAKPPDAKVQKVFDSL
jgi:hypothetical protein